MVLAGLFDASRFRFKRHDDESDPLPLRGTQWSPISHLLPTASSHGSRPTASQQGGCTAHRQVYVNASSSRGVLLSTSSHRGPHRPGSRPPDQQPGRARLDRPVLPGFDHRVGRLVLVPDGGVEQVSQDTANPANGGRAQLGVAPPGSMTSRWLRRLRNISGGGPRFGRGWACSCPCLPLPAGHGPECCASTGTTAAGRRCAADGVYEFQLVDSPLRVTVCWAPRSPIAMSKDGDR